jgi:uroporphyrinogen decarboxylase
LFNDAMTKREVVQRAFTHQKPPYVPWSFSLTSAAKQKLMSYYGVEDEDGLEQIVGNHQLRLGGPGVGFMTELGNHRVRDHYGVIWDRSIDPDIGHSEVLLLPEPTLEGFRFPDPAEPWFYAGVAEQIAKHPDRLRTYNIGFSLFERAWSLRGMENLLMDFHEHPGFVRELLRRIADFNIGLIRGALRYGIDVVRIGDDWGQQRGLIMGPRVWREFIKPELKRTYSVAKEAGLLVSIHCCGDVDELFDDLVEIGVDSFNPFQPEVMDIHGLFARYRGRLAFHGGLSTQTTLPRGTPEEVRRETESLLEMGREGGYLFAPSHAVTGDVPVENMVAFIECVRRQPGYEGNEKPA